MTSIMEDMQAIKEMSDNLEKEMHIDIPKGEMSHEQKTTRFYAHDYRDMAMSEDSLMDMLEDFAEVLQCSHQCSSNCRKVGCNCACGEYHF